MNVSDRLERTVFLVLGVLLAIVGGYALLRGLGAISSDQSHDLVLSASRRRFLGDHEPWWWLAGSVVCLLATLAGFSLLRRQLHAVPQAREQALSQRSERGVTRVEGGALTDALVRELEGLPNVDGASVHLRRGGDRPTLALDLDVPDDADMTEIRAGLEDYVLERFRRTVEAEEVRAQVRIKLGGRGRQRVR